MNQTLASTSTSPSRLIQQEIKDCFLLLRDCHHKKSLFAERRNSERFEFPFPVFLTPFDEQEGSNVDGSFGVIGRHLCTSGFDFYHHQPIADKIVIASFEYSPDRWLGFKNEADLVPIWSSRLL